MSETSASNRAESTCGGGQRASTISTLSIAVLRGDLAQAVQHARRRLDRDHAPARWRKRPGEWQRVSTGARPDVEPRLARPDVGEERVQGRLVGPRRVGSEQAGHRRVEVRAVRDLADTVDLLAVRSHARGPCRRQEADVIRARIDVGIGLGVVPRRDGHLADELGVRGEDRAQATIPVGRLGQREGTAPEQHRVATRVVGIGGHGDRSQRRRRRRRAAPRWPPRASVGWSPRTMRAASSASAGSADMPTCNELARPWPGVRIDDPLLVPPGDRGLEFAASSPSTTTTRRIPAAATRSSTCWRTGRPSIGASSLRPPNRDPAPAASTMATIRSGVMRTRRAAARDRRAVHGGSSQMGTIRAVDDRSASGRC